MGLSVITKIKLLLKLKATVNAVEEGVKMKSTTKVIAAILGLITALLEVPAIQDTVNTFITAHPAVAFAIGGIGGICALLHSPRKTIVPLLLVAILLLPVVAAAQTADPANIYAGGGSYNVGATPSIAGTALYAHLLTDGTYAFTVVDALPSTTRPFTVSTNIGVGVVKKVATIGRVPIYMPLATGFSWTGHNSGWQWSGGGAAPIWRKGQYQVLLTARFLKSSVSNGSGYQPIVGALFAWGQ